MTITREKWLNRSDRIDVNANMIILSNDFININMFTELELDYYYSPKPDEIANAF